MFARLTAAALLASIPAMTLGQDSGAAEDAKPVTRMELSNRLDTDYADLDANKDGKVNATEINARLVKSAEAELEVIKKERDAAFAKFDTDSNGTISRAEFDARAKLPAIKEPDAKPFLDRFDANKDGNISKDEFRAPTMSNFERLDKDKDGTLSIAEQSSAPAATASKAPVKKAVVKETPPIGR
jgi:Ca2+-binding EF-hand superfamily protein